MCNPFLDRVHGVRWRPQCHNGCGRHSWRPADPAPGNGLACPAVAGISDLSGTDSDVSGPTCPKSFCGTFANATDIPGSNCKFWAVTSRAHECRPATRGAFSGGGAATNVRRTDVESESSSHRCTGSRGGGSAGSATNHVATIAVRSEIYNESSDFGGVLFSSSAASGSDFGAGCDPETASRIEPLPRLADVGHAPAAAF